MANQYSTKGITGKSTRKMTQPRSTALQAAVVSATDLADRDTVLNDITKSGKQPGALFITKAASGGQLNFAIAEGTSPIDKWHTLTPDGVYTPA